MAYTPTKHIESNKSFAPSQGNPTDARAYYYDNANSRQRIYQNRAEVLSEVTGTSREGHVLYVVNTGGTITNGYLTGGTNEFWYWKDNYTDAGLVLFAVIPTKPDWNAAAGNAAEILNKPTIPAAQLPADWDAVSGVIRILNKPTIPDAQIPADWDAATGAVNEVLNKPDIPDYGANNGITKGLTVYQLGGDLLKDTVISGNYKLSLMNGRVGIGMVPVFPLDIYNNWANLAAQLTSQLGLVNGQARIGLLSAMQIYGANFTHTILDQVSGNMGQLVWYNSGAHVLNQLSNYAAQTGKIIGYATGSVAGGVISCFAAIADFGKNGTYSEAAGFRVTMPVGQNFIDAANFTGVVTSFYAFLIEPYDSNTFPNGSITNVWGFYQRGSEKNRLGGKIVFDTTDGGTGAQTINKPSGTFNIAAGQTAVTITNNMVTANSLVMVGLKTLDSTAKSCVAVESSGSFTVTLDAAATGVVKIKFIVYN